MHNRVIRAVERAVRDKSIHMIANTLPQSLIDNPLLSQWVGFEEPAGCASPPARWRSGKAS